MMVRLFFMRHGETEWSLSGQHSGRADIPLTQQGEAEAQRLGVRIRAIKFDHVWTSPLQRAIQTCTLAGLSASAEIHDDLIEWDNGDYEGRTGKHISVERPDWNIFQDGCPNGEMPSQVAARADRMIHRLNGLRGNVAIFSHGHFGRVLGARWIGLSVEHASHFLLNTASVSVLCYAHDRVDQPAIALWNSATLESIC